MSRIEQLRRYIQIKSNAQIKVDREDQSADFSSAPAQQAHLLTTPLRLDKTTGPKI